MSEVKIKCSTAFGYDYLHPGGCCGCCGGYCPESDWDDSEPDHPLLKFTHDDREWISDRFVSLDASLLTEIPANTTTATLPSAAALFATKVTGNATGLLGTQSLQLLDRIPSLHVSDSDVVAQHAFTIDGQMVGFAVKGKGGLPVGDLARARLLAGRIGAVGEAPLVLAAHVITNLLAAIEGGRHE